MALAELRGDEPAHTVCERVGRIGSRREQRVRLPQDDVGEERIGGGTTRGGGGGRELDDADGRTERGHHAERLLVDRAVAGWWSRRQRDRERT